MAGKALEHFFNARVGITPPEYTAMVEALCDSAVAVDHELIEAAGCSAPEPPQRSREIIGQSTLLGKRGRTNG